MITLLKKFKNVLNGTATVYHTEDNSVYINCETVQIKLFGPYISDTFKLLSNTKSYDFNGLIKGLLKECELLSTKFEHYRTDQLICENINLPQIKIGINPNNHASIVNNAYIFDGCLWTTDSHYLLKTDLHIDKNSRVGIPARIYNLFKQIFWIGKEDDIIQISGIIDSKHGIVIQYKELEYLDKNINMLKSVNKPLDTCDDGIIYNLTEITDLKLSGKRMENLIRYNDGLISVYNNIFKCNTDEFKHDLFNNVLKKFTVDAYYLKLFKKIFKKASIKTLGTLSGRTTGITLHDNDNSLLLMCVME
jgi:hypothetical protein